MNKYFKWALIILLVVAVAEGYRRRQKTKQPNEVF